MPGRIAVRASPVFCVPRVKSDHFARFLSESGPPNDFHLDNQSPLRDERRSLDLRRTQPCHSRCSSLGGLSMSWLNNVIRKPQRPRRPRLSGYRPKVESLEDRTVLSFFTSPSFAVGTAPHGEAVADFNGDGKLDVAVVNEGSNTVSILLGNGDGTFRPKTDFATGAQPWGIAVGDFNGDGKLDLVVVNRGARSLSILLGNGDGTFQPKTDIALPATPVTALPVVPLAVTVGDFNGDGKADLAVATQVFNTNDVTILL